MNEDKLILYYYDDGLDDRERKEIRDQLATDDVLAARYDRLVAELSSMKFEDQAAPSYLKAQWHDVIDSAARKEQRPAFQPTSFFWGVAVTAALALGIGIGTLFTGQPQQTDFPLSTNTSANAEEQFTRGMLVHFRDSSRDLGTLENGSDRIVLLARIIEQNRMMQRLAEDSQSPELARVLRAMEPILVRLADDELSPADANALRTQLIFEMNVVLTKMANTPSDDTSSI